MSARRWIATVCLLGLTAPTDVYSADIALMDTIPGSVDSNRQYRSITVG